MIILKQLHKSVPSFLGTCWRISGYKWIWFVAVQIFKLVLHFRRKQKTFNKKNISAGHSGSCMRLIKHPNNQQYINNPESIALWAPPVRSCKIPSFPFAAAIYFHFCFHWNIYHECFSHPWWFLLNAHIFQKITRALGFFRSILT